jgi:hypothetical protein
MKYFIFSLLVVFLVLVSIETFAAPPPDPEDIPLDPFSWVLLATAGAVACKKYYDYRKSKEYEDNEL